MLEPSTVVRHMLVLMCDTKGTTSSTGARLTTRRRETGCWSYHSIGADDGSLAELFALSAVTNNKGDGLFDANPVVFFCNCRGSLVDTTMLARMYLASNFVLLLWI